MSTIDTIDKRGNAKKTDIYKWIVDDAPGTLEWIDKALIHVHPDYQRPLSLDKVLEFASCWSWAACGAIAVGHSNGVYWVYDGQHRLEAAKRHTDITLLPCVVFKAMTVPEQARAFVKANINRKAVTIFARYRAMLVGGDPDAMRVQSLFDSLGIVAKHSPSKGLEIKALYWTTTLAKRDMVTLEKVLRLSAALSRASNQPITQTLVHGLSYMHRNVAGGLDNGPLVKRILAVGQAELELGARKFSAYVGSGGEKIYAQGMLDRINAKLRNKFELVDKSAEQEEPA